MFFPLAFTHVIALFASLVLSLLVIPALCYLAAQVPGRKADHRDRGRPKGLPSRSFAGAWIIKPPSSSISTVLLAGALFLVPRLGTEFMPVMDEGAFDMDVPVPAGDLRFPNRSK